MNNNPIDDEAQADRKILRESLGELSREQPFCEPRTTDDFTAAEERFIAYFRQAYRK